ncbi:MAG: T9SS type A sorting domain-containing protein, partial [Candidatus Marinimicrobia bacterium]|nr:T9SS type A sorting domain-containing protein [Candidatus Neomarinimicrobiota bacterium]
GTSIVPITDDTTEDKYNMRAFLDNGGNLMLADMDYLYAWGMPAAGTFVAGEFAYDYLGIGNYENDPSTGGVSDADLEMAGFAGDPVTDDFVPPNYYGVLDYEIPDPSWVNWGDFIEPAGGAVSIFKGKSSNNGMAIRKQGTNFKTVTFAFPIALAADINEFQILLENSLLYFDRSGSEVPVNVAVVSEFSLSQNYPNPFNPQTTIRYQIKTPGDVILEIFDLRGRKVDSLVNEYQQAGYYDVVWDAQNTSSGIYFVRLQAGGFVDIKKCIKLK